MIVVTAMPVANAKARTIITKIVFMTLILGTSQAASLNVTEPARRSVTGVTNNRFHGILAARVRTGGVITFCIHCRFGFAVLGAGALERGQISELASTLSRRSLLRKSGAYCLFWSGSSRDVWSPSPECRPSLPCLRSWKRPDPNLLVPQTAGMRDLFELNGAWMEERHDVYECCAFAGCRCDIGADTVRLHSHQIVA